MARAAVLGRLNWTLGEVVELIDETPRVRSIVLEVPDWPGFRAGQHIDVRLTAEDGYQAQRSYSIASAPEDERLTITVEGLPDGEVSEYLVGELRRGDMLELRGPIGGYFVWEEVSGEPLLLVSGGSGIVPLMSMLRHREAADESFDRSASSSSTQESPGSPISSQCDRGNQTRIRPPVRVITSRAESQWVHRSTMPGACTYACSAPTDSTLPQPLHAIRADVMSSTNTSPSVPAIALPSSLSSSSST